MSSAPPLTAADFASDQNVKWCPGCGDYSILKQVQSVLPSLGLKREEIVFISGIGCSSRFPYYMNTYGLHSIHGRAPAVATGLKTTRPELSVWIITGDGDALSIGGNHFIQLLRRNLDVNLLLFNNAIYGLTKGQVSPTSQQGLRTQSSPLGSINRPFNTLSLALGVGASFVARTLDHKPKHLRAVLAEAHHHKGTSYVEIYQNCPVFNDRAFGKFSDRDPQSEQPLYLEAGKPLRFGAERKQGIRLEGLTPEVFSTEAQPTAEGWIHTPRDKGKAQLLAHYFTQGNPTGLPVPFGVLYREERPTYEDLLNAQTREAIAEKGSGKLDELLQGTDFWEVS